MRSVLEEARGDLAAAERAAREAVSYAKSAATVGYELQAAARQAHLLARLGEHEDAKRLANDVLRAMSTRPAMERAARIYVEAGRALSTSGDAPSATRAFTQARGVVDRELSQLRDENLRARYAATPTLRALDAAFPAAGGSA